ncbi:LPS export ABC transporter periplasmic protein LptC [Roseimarinus sediminis]|uniref:LPS export ABC transporter periplasmic protein LptC n=1 Tax=Roseimarinus sediminis TaxID=1610899 RepID=UPI003D19F675
MPSNRQITKHKIVSIASTWLFAVLFLSCRNNDIEKIRSFSHPPGAPEVVAENIEVLFSDSAVVRNILNAPSLKIYQDEEEPYTEFPEGFSVQQFNSDEQITSSIEASYGKHYEKKQLWELRQNVVAVTESNDTLKTDLLFWDEEKDLIYSDQFVKFIQKEQIITGIGFESDLQMKRWHIKNVKGTVTVEVEE